ncbi:MAG: hypothetical protein ACOVNZ_06800, partial [Crocinitomicaceae bacterium]
SGATTSATSTRRSRRGGAKKTETVQSVEPTSENADSEEVIQDAVVVEETPTEVESSNEVSEETAVESTEETSSNDETEATDSEAESSEDDKKEE